jgi:hypothetical protein
LKPDVCQNAEPLVTFETNAPFKLNTRIAFACELNRELSVRGFDDGVPAMACHVRLAPP